MKTPRTESVVRMATAMPVGLMLKTDISRVVEKKDTYLQILIRTDKNKTVFLGKLFTEGLFNETEDYDLAILQEIKNIPDHIFNLRANKGVDL